MSKPLRTVAIIAGVVALTFAIPGVGTAIGASIGVSISAGTAATIAAVASATAAVASAGAQALQKPPDMRGTVSQVLIGANMPVIYGIGWSLLGGALVYDKSANGPDNYDRTQIIVYSAAGPVEQLESLNADYSLIGFPAVGGRLEGVASGFYGADGGYLWINSRLGTRPDTALTAPAGRAAFSQWGADYKLSGYAAASLTMEFDEDGVRWASGIPQWGMIGKWVKIYDPRLDSTYPGGSGPQRWADEATWEWSENPALHALTYARGRFVGDVKIVGAGIPQAAIDTAKFVELANICDANGWKAGGALYEGPGLSKWDNLKRVLHAAAAEPVWAGGMLTVKISAPRVALDTIVAADLADPDVSVRVMRNWKDRHNTIVPRYRSPDHRWEYVQAAAVQNATYLAEDGEEKTDEVQFDLCQDVDQAAQLAAYTLSNRREFGPITLRVKPRLIGYQVGDALDLDLGELLADDALGTQLAVIVARTVDPAGGAISLTLESETTAKHAWALGRTGVAPPTPTILTPEEVNEVVNDLSLTNAEIAGLINTSSVIDPDPTSALLTAGETTITVDDHFRRYDDKTVAVEGGGNGGIDQEDGFNLLQEDGFAILFEPAVPDITGLVPGKTYHVGYHDFARAGGAVTYVASLSLSEVTNGGAGTALVGMHYVGTVATAGAGSGGTNSGGGAVPPGYNGGGVIV